jgi:hypothetical protein
MAIHCRAAKNSLRGTEWEYLLMWLGNIQPYEVGISPYVAGKYFTTWIVVYVAGNIQPHGVGISCYVAGNTSPHGGGISPYVAGEYSPTCSWEISLFGWEIFHHTRQVFPYVATLPAQVSTQ